ncbi:MAG: DEAD/DEAH box helicase [Methanobrevibacter sp.]|uniref:DEAD/DEAH box helicase n=1 Tax=Methanobrevibacter sp. TaxID=66852 RepID=UPI0025D213B9|nr:DEAD/DEAH box helicase [Methanobrevibacter sp.]MBE6497312.1 DEAD/DEAH box helicase [Methanobrevibacter sp.]
MISKSEYLKLKEIEMKEIISSETLKKSLNQTYARKNGAEFNRTYSESYLWRYALYISSRSCYILETDKDNETAILSLKMAAEIYENLYYVSDEYDIGYCLLLSSLCYDLSGYQANAKCLIDELEKEFDYYSLKTNDELNNLENLFLKTIQLFLQKKIYLLNDELIQLRTINPNRLHSAYEKFLNNYISLLTNLIEFIFEGDENLIEAITFHSQNAYKSILYSGNVLMSHLMHLFNVRLEIFFEKNIWTNMDKYIDTSHPLWNKFIKLKTKDYYSKFEIKPAKNRQSIMEFWNSQLNALNANIIGENQENENYIIKMPTSAGKTFITEILLLNSLIENENSKAIYITPYLSLTNEINESLSSLEKLGFTLSNMTKSYEIDEYENLWVEEADVLIATPEKIDLLYRNEKEFFKDVSIIIIDEGHIVGDNGKRSVLVELLISKLKMKLKNARFIFVSAMMNEEDTKDLSKWITHKENNVLESPKINGEIWAPTRRLIGYLDYKNNKGHIEYPEMKMFVPNIIKQNTYSYINPDSGRENNKKFPNNNGTKSDITVELAYNLISEGNILIFTSQARYTESIGESFLELFNLKKLVNKEINSNFKNNEKIHSLNISKKLLGEKHPVTRCLQYNIGIHNGDLPEELRKSIESDFKNKKLKVLIASNTISHGINFPIKNSIIHALNYNEKDNVSKRDFWNLVGRTGRAGKETEGKIIFIAKNQNDKDRFWDYTNKIHIEKLNSRLLEIIQEIIASSNPYLIDKLIQEEIEPILFNILVEESMDTLDENVIENTIKNSLFYIQSDQIQKEQLSQRLKHSGNIFYSEITDKELRTIYSKTGLTLKSNTTISNYVLENLDEFDELIESDDTELLLEHIFNLFPNLKEMDNPKLKAENDEMNFFTENKDVLIDITKKWIDGVTIEELVNLWDNNFNDNKLHIFLNNSLQYNFSWGIHSLLEILIYHLNSEYGYEIETPNELPDNIKNFSSYIKYGLNNPETCKCKNLGIENRDTCIKIVNEYLNENDNDWFFNIDFDNLINNPNFNDSEKKEIIQILQEKNYNQKQFDTFLGSDIEVHINTDNLDIGSILHLERDLTNKFNLYKIDLKYGNSIIGSLPINYSKALAIEMDLNNVKLIAEVKEIDSWNTSIILKKMN